MKRVIAFLVLVLITIALNISLGKGERYEFDATELPSALTEGEKKVSNTGIPGNLTFGPYVALKKGNYKLSLYYNTDTDLNTWDVFSNSNQLTFGQGVLTSDKTVVFDTFYLDDSFEDIEVRTYYQGEGELGISKIVLIREQTTERWILNVSFLFVSILLFTLKKKNYRQCMVFIFAGVLFCPLFCTVVQEVFGKNVDIELEGNFESYSRPAFGLPNFENGEYQDKFELWWNNSFSQRGRIVKAYNQFRYSLFGLGTRIIGKDGDIFEENYITEALCLDTERNFSIEENRTELRAYYETLVRLQDKLEERGIELLVYTTPNKAVEHSENMPWTYNLFQREGTVRAIELWREYTASGELNYLDTTQYLKDNASEYPMFYLSGIHWTRPAEQKVSALLVQNLNESLKQPLNEIVFGELRQTNEPYWRDSDVYDLLNVYHGKKDNCYFEYATEVNTKASPIHVLMQGDSFALGFRQDFKQNNLGASIVNIFYNEYVIENNDAYVPITSWETFDFGKYLSEADVVVIETNEALMYTYNRGFAEALEHWLDYGEIQENQGTVQDVSKAERVIDFSVNKDYSNNLIHGYYHAENGFCWMTKNSRAVLRNEEIYEKGLQVELIVPKELGDVKELSITVNGTVNKKCTAEIGVQSVVFTPDELSGESDIIEVEITCDSVFNPKKQGISADDRDLSVQIMYIGECR